MKAYAVCMISVYGGRGMSSSCCRLALVDPGLCLHYQLYFLHLSLFLLFVDAVLFKSMAALLFPVSEFCTASMYAITNVSLHTLIYWVYKSFSVTPSIWIVSALIFLMQGDSMPLDHFSIRLSLSHIFHEMISIILPIY